MCRLKLKLFCFYYCVIFCLCSFSCWGDAQDEPYSQRIAIQEHLDYCLTIVTDIENGEVTQEEGLQTLRATIYVLKFHLWFIVKDEM